jgi:alpha-1,2-mannosyltransferase
VTGPVKVRNASRATKDLASRVMTTRGGPTIFLMTGIAATLVMTWLTVRGGSLRPWLFSGHYQSGFTDLYYRLMEVSKVRKGSNIYVPFGVEAFTYPPAAISLFFPLTTLAPNVAYFAWTELSILCMAGTYFVVLQRVRTPDRVGNLGIATWATIVTVALFAPMAECLAWGQTSTILLLLVTLDLLMIRGRYQGVLVGIAAALKLYPGLFIVFWLFRRSWRTAGVSIATFVSVTAISWVLWPKDADTFFLQILPKGSETGHFGAGFTIFNSASVSSFYLRLPFLPKSAVAALVAVTSVLILVGGMAAAVRLDRSGLKISALVTLVAMSVVVSPVTWDHYFTFAPLLVFVIHEVGFKSILGRASLAAFVIFIVPWFIFRHSLGKSVYALPAENALFLATMLVIGAAWFHSAAMARAETGEVDSVPDRHRESSSRMPSLREA